MIIDVWCLMILRVLPFVGGGPAPDEHEWQTSPWRVRDVKWRNGPLVDAPGTASGSDGKNLVHHRMCYLRLSVLLHLPLVHRNRQIGWSELYLCIRGICFLWVKQGEKERSLTFDYRCFTEDKKKQLRISRKKNTLVNTSFAIKFTKLLSFIPSSSLVLKTNKWTLTNCLTIGIKSYTVFGLVVCIDLIVSVSMMVKVKDRLWFS